MTLSPRRRPARPRRAAAAMLRHRRRLRRHGALRPAAPRPRPTICHGRQRRVGRAGGGGRGSLGEAVPTLIHGQLSGRLRCIHPRTCESLQSRAPDYYELITIARRGKSSRGRGRRCRRSAVRAPGDVQNRGVTRGAIKRPGPFIIEVTTVNMSLDIARGLLHEIAHQY
eukprot:gene2485-biopygen11647